MEDFEEVCEEPDLSAQPKEVCNVRIVQTCTNGTRVATKQRCNPITENKCRTVQDEVCDEVTEKKCAPAAEIDPACEDESKGVICREVEEEVCQQVDTEQCRPIQRTDEEEE